tara:strand:+ start:1473 stop:2327 length:855 start_codon:yes stop_codon:yes gene_type:complete
MNVFFNKLKEFKKPLYFVSFIATYNILFVHRNSIISYFKSLLKKEPKKLKNILTKGEEYVEKRKEQFLEFVEEIDNSNANMSKEFYNKESYNEILKEEENELEEIWKSKYIMENTPRGNVFMSYDPYKLAFSYYSDSNISYSILNAVAMRFCIIFKCKDLFVDQLILKGEKESPLIKILYKEKKKVKKNDDLPFAKLKNYNIQDINKKNEEKKKEDEKKVVKEITNKFVCLGKTYQMKWTKGVSLKKKKVSFESSFINNLNAENDLQKRVMDYKAFKKQNEKLT